jgi:hypothetical protein
MMIALGSVGCDTAIHDSLVGTPDAPISPKCLEAAQHSDFPWIRDNVLAPSCSNFTTCHAQGNPPAHLDLTAANAFGNLVDVMAVTVPGWGVRVARFDPDASYLLVKLGVVPGPVGDAGTTMPPNSPPLCAQKLDAVRRWIAEGAPLEGAGGMPDAGPAASDAGTGD